MTCISNYSVLECAIGGHRQIGWAGSVEDAADIADRHAARSGIPCIVTEFGKEITGVTLHTSEVFNGRSHLDRVLR